MNEEQDKMFHIKYGDREYVVMTKKMQREIMMGSDIAKKAKFLVATIVANDALYAVLRKMVVAYEGEEVYIQGENVNG